jgi:aspartate aminotransferase
LQVDLVLNTPEIYEQWTTDIVTMASRVKESRKALRDGLVAAGTPGTWDHIVEQQGMFSYTGLSPSQCEALVEKYHIYLPDNGRIRWVSAALSQSVPLLDSDSCLPSSL